MATITPERAAAKLRGLESMDPRGMSQAGDVEAMTNAGHCLRVVLWEGERVAGSAVVVMTKANGVAWVEAAKGWGEGMTQAIDAAARAWGRGNGCTYIGCQTKRAGLVARLHRLGWKTSGHILKDTIQ